MDAALQDLEQQPDQTDVRLLSGTFVKEIRVQKAGTHLPQHVHQYAHVSVIVRGAARIYEGPRLLGVFEAPDAVRIKPRIGHRFVTLKDDTVILCVHDGGID